MKTLFFGGALVVAMVSACAGARPAAPTSAPVSPPEASPTAATVEPSTRETGTPRASAPQPPAPPKEPEITSVRVAVSNGCDTKVDYCVEDGSTLNTTLTQRTTTTHTVRPGAKIRTRKGSSCGDVLFTVPASKDEAKTSICSK